MERFKEFIKTYKIPLTITLLFVVIIFSWTLINSYSESANDSAWDGVVARSFTSGTGTEANPYVISNASEYAYFKSVIEGDDAIAYVDKNYVIESGFNYGEYDFSINNSIPFSGTIDGQGNLMYNLKITNNWFNSLEGANLKNINLDDVEYTLVNETGALLANEAESVNIEMFIFNGNATSGDETSFGGFVFNTKDSTYNNIILNYDITSDSEVVNTFANTLENDTGNNILIKSSEYKAFGSDADITVNSFNVTNNEIELVDIKNINDYINNDYKLVINKDKFIIEKISSENEDIQDDIPSVNPSEKPIDTPDIRGGAKSPVANDTITEHASGSSGNTFYINDLTADLNYLTGLNYTEVRSTSLPSGTSTGYYDAANLVKVQIIYDGADINYSTRVGALSPISEPTNKFVYFKYIPLERTSSGALATNSDGDNYIKIELIDNPFSKRPYTTGGGNTVEYGFNGWVCNQDSDTTTGLCEKSKFSFRKDDYTRYVEVPVTGGSQIRIHLNASWHKADVVTSASNITNFKNMSMQFAGDITYTTETAYYNYRWNNTYYTMRQVGSVSRNQYMDAGYYYKTNTNGTTYTYIATRRQCNSRTCYIYEAVNNVITQGLLYSGGSYTFVANYTQNSNLTTTTINNYNANYMDKVYEAGGMYSEQAQVPHYHSLFTDGMNTTGYFYKINNPSSTLISEGKIYDGDGNLCTSSCSPGYKLIQYDDEVNNASGNSIYLAEESNGDIVDGDKYYYLVTRDTNIFRYTSTTALDMSDIEVNRPFTVTGTSLTGTSTTGVLEYPYTSGWFNDTYYELSVANDLVIENIKIDGPDTTGNSNAQLGANSKTSRVIYANSNNLKIGRNVTSSDGNNYLIGEAVFGGANNSNVSGTFRVIIESGIFYAYHSGVTSGSSNYTLNETTIFGSDYDRINANNSKLKFLIGLDGYAGGHNTAGSDSLFASFNIVKSGSFGYNSDGTPNEDNTAGMYIGGRSSKCVESITGAKIEGGNLNIIVGGYGYNGSTTTNSTYIGMSGGTVRSIYGGAGHSTTAGNRIINVTGGTVSYSVLGGSDSYDSGDTDDGILQGSTLVYVGGNATIGGGSGTVQGVESGSVFGAGGGDTTSDQKGTVYNSHIIINGGTINTSVYGGGNYGSTGTQYSNTATTVIDILSGTVGNVFGGSKSAGFGQSGNSSSSTIDINMSGGTVGYIYGGSDTQGTAYGSVSIDVTGGTVSHNIYGGGKGESTIVTNDVDVTIGTSGVSGTPTISGNVYGGSALGTVNSTSSNGTANGNTTVTVNNGVVTGSVFGGGEGSSTQTPYVVGNITVTVNDGDVSKVFGGNDQAGSHTKTNEVHLNGGTVGEAYGGGNKSSVTTTHVYLDGSTVTTIYGGSNTSGDVTTSNVAISSGTVQTAYGGNNEGGSCTTTNVTVAGTATINGSIYGGGNQVNTTTTNVTLTSAGSTIPNVYGGGNSASVGTSNVTKNGTTVTNLFGGSNSSGSVTNSYINHNGGTTTTIYGGNNAGGNTITSHVNMHNGTVTTIYGGGYSANGSTSNVVMDGGTVTTIFGGGNSAGLDESNVTVSGGTITDIYGGSNTTGKVDETNILFSTVTGANAIYGGGNHAEVGDTNITFNSGSVSNIYGGGNLAQASGDTNVDLNGGTVSQNVYGGGNYGAVSGDSHVTITDTTVNGSAYAGGNGVSAILYGDTYILVDGDTVIGTANSVPPGSGCVFGGGNKAETGTSANNSTTSVNIAGGTIYGNVYGGANTSLINGSTEVNIGNYAVADSSTEIDDIHIYGHVFGGGEANESGSVIYDWNYISVSQGVNINVDAENYANFLIDGSFYGGGNASSASGDIYLIIKNYGVSNNPKRNISIQRVNYVTLDNTKILLKGAIDRANEYDTELFAISRVDNLILQNNSELYLETGANLLKQFESLDSNGQKAAVTINGNTVTKTVDNRVYLYEGKNLTIAKDEQNTDYGEVHGMSFMGIFNYDNNNNVNTGIYNKNYAPGDLLDWSGTFSRGSYVVGRHVANHNIEVDGFYSHYINEDTQINEVKYVVPTPESSNFYMWFIGENVIEYNVNLVASKYSTLGSVETPFLEFNKPNTSFQILTLDTVDLAQGIQLIDKNDIPRIAANANDANTKFGLSMESSNSGWLTNGRTNFYTTSPTIRGTTYYEGENSSNVPTMLFYLYHSKNLSVAQDLGTVRISVIAITKLSALASEVNRLVINVNMSTALFQTTEYEGAMAPGDKYELFASTATNITTKSKFSAYYGLYATGTNLYRTGYHRVLTSSYVLPVGTKITMLDIIEGEPEYYYHIITQADYNAALAEFNLEGECSYGLSMFTKMGSTSNNSNYNDAAKNAIYYDGTDSSEEFIFIVDFSDTTINTNQLGKTLLIEIRDSNEESIIGVLGIQHNQLTYNLYHGLDSQIDLTVTPSDNPLYLGYSDVFDVLIDYQSSSLGGLAITDTQYFDSKLGVQFYVMNSEGHVLSGTDLTGTSVQVDGVTYYPDINGYTHIKLSDKIGNTEKWLIFTTANASLATGTYTFVIEAFASADGIYYSSADPVTETVSINIISSTYGLKPTINDDSVVFSAVNDKYLRFTVQYTSLLDNPNIRIAMYRRKYDQVYDTNYELVDLNDFIDQTLGTTNNPKEYLLIDDPDPTNHFAIPMKTSLLTGTYRLAFRLYDNNTMIGEIIRYIIIK